MGVARHFNLHFARNFSPRIAGRRRAAAFTFARVFRNRKGAPRCITLVHHAGMVPGERALRGAIEDCAALLSTAAEAPGAQFRFRGPDRGRFAAPERLTVAAASRAMRYRLRRRGGKRATLRRSAGAAIPQCVRSWPMTTPGPTFSASVRALTQSSLTSGSAAPPCSRIPVPSMRRGAPAARTNPARRDASSFITAASEIAKPSANSPIVRAAPPLRGLDGGARVHGESYPIDEDFLSALACAMSARSGIALRFSTAGHCWRPARSASSRCCGRRWRNRSRQPHDTAPPRGTHLIRPRRARGAMSWSGVRLVYAVPPITPAIADLDRPCRSGRSVARRFRA